MRYEWDDEKDKQNRSKHKMSLILTGSKPMMVERLTGKIGTLPLAWIRSQIHFMYVTQ